MFSLAGKISGIANGHDEEKPGQHSSDIRKPHPQREMAPAHRKSNVDAKEKKSLPIARIEVDDIFLGDGVDYVVPSKDMSQSPVSEDMEESPRIREKQSYFSEPVYGPIPPPETAQAWQQTVSSF